jgi:hypothetical protein
LTENKDKYYLYNLQATYLNITIELSCWSGKEIIKITACPPLALVFEKGKRVVIVCPSQVILAMLSSFLFVTVVFGSFYFFLSNFSPFSAILDVLAILAISVLFYSFLSIFIYLSLFATIFG